MFSTSVVRQCRFLCAPKKVAALAVRNLPSVASVGARHPTAVLAPAVRSFSEVAAKPMRVGEKIANLNPGARKLDILFLTNAHNSMSQRAMLELKAMGHSVTVKLAINEQQMIDVVEQHKPELIVGPFLTKYVNEVIWKNYPTLIVHPGIHGDRGASAIDWALQQKKPEWGVTVLSAAEEMDAGDIWSSVNFQVGRNAKTGPITKSSLYGNEVIDAGIQGLKEALHKYLHGIPPTPLDYNDPAVLGTLMPTMKQKERKVDWTMDAAEIVNRIAAADGQPGVIDKIAGESVFLFGAHVEANLNAKGDFAPRTLIARRDEAVCIATGNNGAVWITHIKKKNADGKQFLKLPATRALEANKEIQDLPEIGYNLMDPHNPKDSWKEIWTEMAPNGVCHLHFDIYNGAMNTEQCARLVEAIKEVKRNKDVKVLVLMGGYSYFSNGVHLNTIEASADPAEESWKNINGINDVVLEMMDSPEVVTVSAIRGKAGAGGVMMALGADHVYTHEATILNPHYRAMGLFGSEYWTYNLPLRVGEEAAKKMTAGCQPLSGLQAAEMGLVDNVLGKTVDEFDINIRTHAQQIGGRSDIESILQSKKEKLTPEWRQLVQRHRHRELSIMKENFRDPVYIAAREGFVWKAKPTDTPVHLGLSDYQLAPTAGEIELAKQFA